MAIAQAAVTVATSATVVVAAAKGYRRVLLRNEDAAIAVFIGGATVTNSGATAGVKLPAATTSSTLMLAPGDAIYAAAASGTPTVSYLTL